MIHKREWGIACALIVAAAVGLAACGSGPSPNGAAKNSTLSHPTVESFGVVGGTYKGAKQKIAPLQHDTPTPIPGIEGTIVQVVATNSDTFALTSAGTVWVWGAGSKGQLGTGSTPDFVSTAVKVDFPSGVRVTSLPSPMPGSGAFAIDSHGNVWGWGANPEHDLCLPGGPRVLVPTKIPLPHVTLATGAGGHSLIDSKGTVYACGSGRHGDLGNGSTANNSTPAPVVGLPEGQVKTLVSSSQGSGALMDNGSYYDWGFNAAGQLGDGTTTDSPLPVHVSLPAAVVQVFQGGSTSKNGQTLAILVDGSLWAWGNGTAGQLGNDRTADSSIPIRVTLPDGARPARISTGGDSSYAIDSSGKLWAWGSNKVGQLGTGSSGPNELTPVAVGVSLSQISSTAANVAVLSH